MSLLLCRPSQILMSSTLSAETTSSLMLRTQLSRKSQRIKWRNRRAPRSRSLPSTRPRRVQLRNPRNRRTSGSNQSLIWRLKRKLKRKRMQPQQSSSPAWQRASSETLTIRSRRMRNLPRRRQSKWNQRSRLRSHKHLFL